MQTEAFNGIFYLRPVFYVAVAFIIFFVLFGRKLVGTINGLLDSRIDAIRSELAEASRLRQEAEAMLADAQAQRHDAIAAARALLASAHDEARRLATGLAEDARIAAERRERSALDRIAAAEKAVITELRTAAIEIATTATQHVLAATLTLEDDDILIDRAIADLPAALRAA